MLYDPKWEVPVTVKPDLHWIGTLIAWLEKQSTDTKYDYCAPYRCLMAQFLQAHGITNPDEFALTADQATKWFGDHGHIVHPSANDEWTFGAALERARALLKTA